ncbi:hypothetical protein IWQ60_009227 [Tieghemiomyces parasiticus]|uniref:GTP cyclohydrolase 1 n=1 Tax=Tieghemiomyces parasiticus TaxID=78921 RepID=A0A9W8DPY1_9FUNG|nr:hypothetical protein IWQ60_009227 [Tieghemiomyces parasiticus]
MTQPSAQGQAPEAPKAAATGSPHDMSVATATYSPFASAATHPASSTVSPLASRPETPLPHHPYHRNSLDMSSHSVPMPSTIDVDGLSFPSIGTKQRLNETEEEKAARVAKISEAVKTIIECLGEDPEREGLRKTPDRYAKALMYFSKGYEENIKDVVNDALFEEDNEEMVIVKDIDVYSLCEHHLVPFTGKISIGYIPNRRVLGLSKLARIAEMFSRRLQVQERLTKQIAVTVSEILKPQGVAVVMESSRTITSYMLGRFREDPKTREEFLSLIR